MRVFATVAEAGAFATAARRLGISPPAATRAVAALEQRLGARLLHRTTRKLRLTEAGLSYLADCKRILSEIDEAEASASGSHTEPRGQLGVTAPVMFGSLYVAPIAFEYAARYPQVMTRLLLLDRIADLLEEGLDVAVRIAHLPDSALTAIRVGAVRRVICASPGYLAERGIPRSPRDVEQHDAIAFSALGASRDWSFQSGGRVLSVTPPGRVTVNSMPVAIAAAREGRGLIQPLSYQIAEELGRGELQLVLEAFEMPPLPVHLVHAEGRRAKAGLRAFLDIAVERLRAASARW
jgi:DNA-binding transcriptional LysR family regulator